jgi:hypothetical protein
MNSEEDLSRASSLHAVNANIPRRVSLYSDDAQKLLLISLMLLGGGAIWFAASFYFALQQAHHHEALRREGREAIGRVTRIDGGHQLYVRYTFPFDNADVHGDAKLDYQNDPLLSDGRISYVRVGDQLPIRFLPSDPSVNHPRNWAWWSWWDVIPHLFMLFFSSLGVVGLAYLLRERRLVRKGWVVHGNVTGCAPNRSKFSVDYEFRDENNTLVQGSSDYCEDEQEIGSSILVIYLRNQPKRNDAYPMSTYRAVDV